MATSKYPDDIAQDFETEERLFDFIDEELPTQQSFAIRGQNIRNTLKSLFKTLLPGSENNKTLSLKIIKAKYISDTDEFSISFDYNVPETCQEWALAEMIETINNKKFLKVIPKQFKDDQGSSFQYKNWYYYGSNSVPSASDIIQYFEDRNLIGVDYDYSHYYYYLRFENQSNTIISNGTEVMLIFSDEEINFINVTNNNLDYVTLSLNIDYNIDNLILKTLYFNDFHPSDSYFISSLLFTHIIPNDKIKNGKKLRLVFEGIKTTFNKHVHHFIFYTIDGEIACLVDKSFIKDSQISNNQVTDVLGHVFNLDVYDDENYIVYNNNINQSLVLNIKPLDSASYVKSVTKYYEPRLCLIPPTDYNYKTITDGTQTIYKGLNDTIEGDYTINGIYFWSSSNPSSIYSHKGTLESVIDLIMWNKKWFISGVNY